MSACALLIVAVAHAGLRDDYYASLPSAAPAPPSSTEEITAVVRDLLGAQAPTQVRDLVQRQLPGGTVELDIIGQHLSGAAVRVAGVPAPVDVASNRLLWLAPLSLPAGIHELVVTDKNDDVLLCEEVTIPAPDCALPRVHFETDSATLTTTARAQLEAAQQCLTAHGISQIALHCHADEQASAAYNLTLSAQRCAAVEASLPGISAASFAHGEQIPAVGGHGAWSLAQSRRVELQPLPTDDCPAFLSAPSMPALLEALQCQPNLSDIRVFNAPDEEFLMRLSATAAVPVHSHNGDNAIFGDDFGVWMVRDAASAPLVRYGDPLCPEQPPLSGR